MNILNDTEQLPVIPVDSTDLYNVELEYLEDELSNSLSEQVNEVLNKTDDNISPKVNNKMRILLITAVGLIAVLACLILLIVTESGRKVFYKAASNYIYDSVNKESNSMQESTENQNQTTDGEDTIENGIDNDNTDYKYRHESYVNNYLVIGIEEFGNAKNTDTMILVSINTKDRTIKLTSFLRDIYIESLGKKKLNAFYSEGGPEYLVNILESTFKIHIDGYASVNFESFEYIIDRLGGITIELGKEEAEYLNKKNYISNPIYRNVVPGINQLNGNQALGYCRIRKVKTLVGANDDYGRTLRQRRVLNAVFEKYKSQSIFKLLPIMKECLGYVNTNLEKGQIEKILETVIENKITTMNNFRIPVDGLFEAPKKYNGVKYPLVLDLEKNIMELYKFIYLDTDYEAEEALKKYNN